MATVVIGVTWAFYSDTERRHLREVPNESRTEQFERARDDFAASCSDPNGPFVDHCRDQAEFLVKFPECDQRCAKLVDPFLPQPTR